MKPEYWPPEGTPIPSVTMWECVLCHNTFYSTGSHECHVEARIREIIREELNRQGEP